ncbi:MAG: hypothetical protein HYV07_33075 [Deltaproteobacteria bacterium]|nr:hypothetical protein [Deltaproteobacteria bacterium]
MVPSDIAYVTLIQYGVPAGVESRLIRVEGAPTMLVSASRDLTVVGFDEPQIASIVGTRTIDDSVTTRLASPCEPRMPTPHWAVDEEGARVDTRSLPRLTTALFDPGRCAELDIASEVLCGGEPTRCTVGFSSPPEDSCAYSFQPCPELADRPAKFRLREDFSVCAQDRPGDMTLPSAAPPFDLGGLVLPGAIECSVRLHRIPESSEIKVLRRISLVGTEPRAPASSLHSTLTRNHRGSGWARDLLVLGGEVVVAKSPEFLEVGTCEEDSLASEIQFYATSDGSLVRTSTGPPCLSSLTNDPTTDGFLGISVTSSPGQNVELIRFSSDGRIMGRLAFGQLIRQTLRYSSAAILPFTSVDSLRLGVLFGQDNRLLGDDPTLASYLAIVSLTADELELVSIQQLARTAAVSDAALTEGSRAVVTDEARKTVSFVDLDTGDQLVWTSAFPAARDHIPQAAAWHALSRTALISGVGQDFGLTVFDRDMSRVGTTTFFEKDGTTTHAAPWPRHRELMLVGAMAGGDAWVAAFDPERVAMIPGGVRIGAGMPGPMVTSGDRVWVLLPHEGSLVELL